MGTRVKVSVLAVCGNPQSACILSERNEDDDDRSERTTRPTHQLSSSNTAERGQTNYFRRSYVVARRLFWLIEGTRRLVSQREGGEGAMRGTSKRLLAEVEVDGLWSKPVNNGMTSDGEGGGEWLKYGDLEVQGMSLPSIALRREIMQGGLRVQGFVV